MLITGVTGDREQNSTLRLGRSYLFNTTVHAPVRLQQKRNGARSEPVNSDMAAVHFVSYIFIQYFLFLIAFRLEINFLLIPSC